MSANIVDARGTLCPYPVIALGRAAASLGPSSRITLLSDDPVSVTDVPAWCRMRGAELLHLVEEPDHWRFVVVTTGPGRR